VNSLVEHVPDPSNVGRFHDALRDNAKNATSEGDMRSAYDMAYGAASCEYVGLNDARIAEACRTVPSSSRPRS
jgi:arginine decarboxylase